MLTSPWSLLWLPSWRESSLSWAPGKLYEQCFWWGFGRAPSTIDDCQLPWTPLWPLSITSTCHNFYVHLNDDLLKLIPETFEFRCSPEQDTDFGVHDMLAPCPLCCAVKFPSFLWLSHLLCPSLSYFMAQCRFYAVFCLGCQWLYA